MSHQYDNDPALSAIKERDDELREIVAKTQALGKDKTAAIVRGAESYQRMLDIAARADAHEGIRQGLNDVRLGQGREIEEFFADFEAKHRIPG